jgi:hypothetical protein
VIENAPALNLCYDDLQMLVNQDLDLLEAEERSQQALRERIAELYGELDPGTRLTTVPGLGDYLAAAITAFIGEPRRLTNADQAVALSGLCARLKSSAGHDTANQPLTQHGDPVLRGCAYLAAEICRHYDPELRAFHRRLTARGKHYKQASCALAAKILRRCFALLRDQRDYQVAHHQEMVRTRNEEGKTVRLSVHEVAERLNDGSGVPSPPAENRPALGSEQPSAAHRTVSAENRLRGKPLPPRSRSSMTCDPGPIEAERSLS